MSGRQLPRRSAAPGKMSRKPVILQGAVNSGAAQRVLELEESRAQGRNTWETDPRLRPGQKWIPQRGIRGPWERGSILEAERGKRFN